MPEHRLQKSEIPHHSVTLVRILIRILQQVQWVQFEVISTRTNPPMLFPVKHLLESISFTERGSVGKGHEFGLFLFGVFFKRIEAYLFFPGLDEILFHFGEEAYLLLKGDAFLELVISSGGVKIIILTRMIILFLQG